jgi:hypothetical protein
MSNPPLYSVRNFVATTTRMLLGIACTATMALGCGGNETAPPAEDHTPVSFQVLVNDAPLTAPYQFTVGETVRVRLKFVNAAGEDLDVVEASHFAGLTFNPLTLATVARVPDHNYQFDVTGDAPGTGTVTVGFGHDQLADETSFTPVTVTVVSAGGGGTP